VWSGETVFLRGQASVVPSDAMMRQLSSKAATALFAARKCHKHALSRQYDFHSLLQSGLMHSIAYRTPRNAAEETL
jgi:hypothetical protein